MAFIKSDSLKSLSTNKCEMFPTGKLWVSVNQARGIKGDEMLGFGKADPYVIFTLGGRDHGRHTSTPVHKDGGDKPVWNHNADFPIRSRDEEFDHLNIVVYNENHWPRKDHIIGALSMRGLCKLLTEHDNAVSARWFTLYYNGNQRGETCLSFDFTPISAEKLLQEAHILKGEDKDMHRNHRDIDHNHSPLLDWSSAMVPAMVQGAHLGMRLASGGLV